MRAFVRAPCSPPRARNGAAAVGGAAVRIRHRIKIPIDAPAL